MERIQNIPNDNTADHTSDKVRELDHGDLSSGDGDIGTKTGGNDDQAYAA